MILHLKTMCRVLVSGSGGMATRPQVHEQLPRHLKTSTVKALHKYHSLANMRATFGPLVSYLTLAQAYASWRHSAGCAWAVCDQEIPNVLTPKLWSVRSRLQLTGSLLATRRVLASHRGWPLFTTAADGTITSFLHEFEWEGRRVLTTGSGADPVWTWRKPN